MGSLQSASPSSARQRGSVLFGLVLGVLVGVGAGLVVAIAVSRVPAPLAHTERSRNGAQDRADRLRDRNWDPNAPLYGKTPARKLPGVVQPPVAMVPASAIVTLDPDDAEEFEPEEDPYEYFVQAGDFGLEDLALDMLVRIRGAGVAAAVVRRKGRYSVRIGPYSSREDAESLKLDMDAAGCRCALVRVEK